MDRERVLKLVERVQEAKSSHDMALQKVTLANTQVEDTRREFEIAKNELDKALGLK